MPHSLHCLRRDPALACVQASPDRPLMPAGRVRAPKAEAGARRPVAAGYQIPTPGIWNLDPRAWQPGLEE
jgi:hypothetical protein